MEEIKVWALDGSEVLQLESVGRMESEQLLEEALVGNPDLLIEGLTLIGRQTPTEGGPLDLLGVDEDGRLIVFELKRGTLSRDAVAQVIDYASDLDRMSTDDLSKHIMQNSGEHGIDKIEDFQEWYAHGFGELESLKPMRLFLVGLGTDDRTERMVNFLASNSGMDISLLTFHGFTHDGKTILAKQVEVSGGSGIEGNGTQPLTKEERWTLLKDRAEDNRVRELFIDVIKMFKGSWPESIHRPGKYRYSFWLRRRPGLGRPVSFAHVDPEDGIVRLVFYSRTVELCPGKFRQITDQVKYVTYPRNLDPLESAISEINFLLTADEWEAHKEKLTGLVQAVYEAWENQDADGESGLS